MNPIELFSEWYRTELQDSRDTIPSACCLSTVGLDGYPNARFVSLKEVNEQCLVITGSIAALKGKEIAKLPKVALTFWWTYTQKQVRIQGEASLISPALADRYFYQRPLDTQIIAAISKQGQPLKNYASLLQQFDSFKRPAEGLIPRPEEWGGYAIKPIRMELMTFKESRLHERELYKLNDGHWAKLLLQP